MARLPSSSTPTSWPVTSSGSSSGSGAWMVSLQPPFIAASIGYFNPSTIFPVSGKPHCGNRCAGTRFLYVEGSPPTWRTYASIKSRGRGGTVIECTGPGTAPPPCDHPARCLSAPTMASPMPRNTGPWYSAYLIGTLISTHRLLRIGLFLQRLEQPRARRGDLVDEEARARLGPLDPLLRQLAPLGKLLRLLEQDLGDVLVG